MCLHARRKFWLINIHKMPNWLHFRLQSTNLQLIPTLVLFSELIIKQLLQKVYTKADLTNSNVDEYH